MTEIKATQTSTYPFEGTLAGKAIQSTRKHGNQMLRQLRVLYWTDVSLKERCFHRETDSLKKAYWKERFIHFRNETTAFHQNAASTASFKIELGIQNRKNLFVECTNTLINAGNHVTI